mgnify:CR=1 FL=1
MLAGKRIGVITNHSAISSKGHTALDEFSRMSAFSVGAVFAPEHGLEGCIPAGQQVPAVSQGPGGVPVYGLYSRSTTDPQALDEQCVSGVTAAGASFDVKKPEIEWLERLDALVFDVQDFGSRYNTFLSTLRLCLEAAAEAQLPFIVLDRPNPILGDRFEGFPLQPEYESYVGFIPGVLARHGLTTGEVARLICGTIGLDVDLSVARMDGWTRNMWFDRTGLPWVPPTPNMVSLDTALVYVGTCLVEGTNLSEGRGTLLPFQWIGAPWLDSRRIAEEMNARKLPGVLFSSASFLPLYDKHEGCICQGIHIHVLNRDEFKPFASAALLLESVKRLHPDRLLWIQAVRESLSDYGSTATSAACPFIDLIAGTARLRVTIETGEDLTELLEESESAVCEYEDRIQEYMLYASNTK